MHFCALRTDLLAAHRVLSPYLWFRATGGPGFYRLIYSANKVGFGLSNAVYILYRLGR